MVPKSHCAERTLRFEAGICKVGVLGSGLADLQLWLLFEKVSLHLQNESQESIAGEFCEVPAAVASAYLEVLPLFFLLLRTRSHICSPGFYDWFCRSYFGGTTHWKMACISNGNN